MGKKTITTVENKAPQFVEQPKNPYYEDAKKSLDNLDFTTPIIQAYGQQENLIKESGNDFFGANTSPELAEKVRNNQLFRSQIDKGKDLSAAKQNEINTKFGATMSLGDATKPIAYSPGSTQTVKQPFDWSSVIMGGANVASSAIM